jgi:hypothetical protein
MKKIALFIYTLIGLGMLFSMFSFLVPYDPSISKKERLILATEAQAAKEISAKYHMSCIGSGGAMHEKVEMSFLSFTIYQPLNKDALRCLLINCVEDFLKIINTNEELRPHLIHYPFTEKEIKLEIFPKYPNGREVFDPIPWVISASNGKIIYRTQTPEGKIKYEDKQVDEESFEEARKIVQQQGNNCESRK